MKNRIWYLDFLKVISAVAVIFVHVISEYWYTLNISGFDFKILTIFDSVVRFCVPIYLMVSGALFLYDNKEISVKDMFKKYILRIFLIFVFWTMSYTIIFAIVNGDILTIKNILNTFINTILGKGIFHLRFLVILLGFYLSVPIFKLITKKENKKILEYLIILLFIFHSVTLISSNVINMDINYPILFINYTLYFVLGYYLNTFDLSKKITNIIYAFGIVSLIITPILSIYHSTIISSHSELFLSYMSPNVVIYSSCIFLFCKNLFKKFKNKDMKVLNMFTKAYFGVYIIHGLILGFYSKLGLFDLNISLWLLVIILTLLITITSFVVSYILCKIPVIKKFVSLN